MTLFILLCSMMWSVHLLFKKFTDSITGMKELFKNVVIQMLYVSAHLYSITVNSHNPFFGKIFMTSSPVQLLLY